MKNLRRRSIGAACAGSPCAARPVPNAPLPAQNINAAARPKGYIGGFMIMTGRMMAIALILMTSPPSGAGSWAGGVDP
jgi:hypothetical protein